MKLILKQAFSQPVKSFTAVLALTLTLSPLASFAAFFQDVQTHWAKQPIETLSAQNIITGYPDGSFRPDGLVSRAEFSAMLVKALNLNTRLGGSQSTFSDVPAQNWAYPAIETVRANGLVSGYPNGQFLPNRQISRAEAMAILASASRMPMPNDATAQQVLSAYRDMAKIPQWARPAVAQVIQSGVFANAPSAGNDIEPLRPATRADVAAMVENLRERMNLAGQNVGGLGSLPSTTLLQAHLATVPANTRFTGTLNQGAVNSELNKVGDEIRLNVDQALVSGDNRVVVPVGSQIIGRITQVNPAGRTGKPATLEITFNQIQTPDGQRYPIQGSVATTDGILHGGDTKGRILKALGTAAIGAGLGAALGTAMGPLSGGHVGKGAIYGTILGAGAGAVAAAVEKGKPVTLGSGDRLEIKLDQPLTVQVP